MISNVDSLRYILPECALVATLVALFVTTFVKSHREGNGPIYSYIALGGVTLSIILTVVVQSLEPAAIFMGLATFDGVSTFFKYIFGVSIAVAIIFSQQSRDLKKSDAASYYILLMVLAIGMNFLAMASNLLLIYLALEMVSISSYLLTGYVGGVKRSTEAALKYVIYGGVASGVMIYGFSLLFGLTGTMNLGEISQYLLFNPVNRSALFIAVIMSLAGFGFKIAAFPFHMWSPDVYEGAPTPFTALLSVGPKAAGFSVLLRFMLVGLFSLEGSQFIDIKSIDLTLTLSILAVATMTVGNFVALRQDNIKRMLAYSSVAHAGYMLMGLAAANTQAIQAIMFYLVVYLVMNLGAFLVVIIIANQFGVEEIDDYKGLAFRGGAGAVVAVAMAIFMFSLTGLPPTAGFIGKFYLFGAVVKGGLYTLGVIGALNSVVSLYYYARVAKVMFFNQPKDEVALAKPGVRYGAILVTFAFLSVYLGLFWQPVASWVQASSQLLP